MFSVYSLLLINYANSRMELYSLGSLMVVIDGEYGKTGGGGVFLLFFFTIRQLIIGSRKKIN